MTEKKPAGMSAERWIDRQVREARERGDFDNLPGAGRPLPNIDQPYDELWWAREFIEREKVNILPETLRLRRDIEVFVERLPAMAEEAEVRLGIRELNDRVLVANSRYVEGPAAPVWPLDEERMVSRWRRERVDLSGRRAAQAARQEVDFVPRPARQGTGRTTVVLAGVAVVSAAAAMALVLALT